jgi:hypothetical protein
MRRSRDSSLKEIAGAGPITIELSQAQVDRVIRDMSGAGNVSLLLSRLADGHRLRDSSREILSDRRLSRSLLQGLSMLAAMPVDGGCIGNAELADALGMTLSSAHRYVTTLVAAGLVEREPITRKYRIANARS